MPTLGFALSTVFVMEMSAEGAEHEPLLELAEPEAEPVPVELVAFAVGQHPVAEAELEAFDDPFEEELEAFIVPAGQPTTIDTLELLFAVFRSVVLADTVAVFHNVELAAEFTSALMLRVATALGKRLPIVHAPVELAYEVLAEAVAFSNVRPVGKVSVATTPVETLGPFAVTVMV